MPGPSRWRWLLTALLLAQLLAGHVRAQCTIWQQIHDQNPETFTTFGPAGGMTFDARAGQVFMYGVYQGGVWYWDGDLWRKRPTSILVAGSPGNYAGPLAYDSLRQRVVMPEPGNPQTVWEWTGNAWIRILRTGPSPRYGYGVCFDAARGRVILFGGQPSGASTASPLGDTWEWDGHSWTLAASQGPPPRRNYSLTFDSARGKTLLFGGQATTNVLFDDTWEWDGAAWTQVASSGPEARYGACVTFDSIRQKAVLFGGYTTSAAFPFSARDTWEWDGNSWTRRSLGGPIDRVFGHMAFDPARGRTVMLGGFHRDSGSAAALQETWEWDGEQWTRRGPTVPFIRSGHAMAFDSARNEVVLFGGFTSNLATDAHVTWGWDGHAWTRRAETGPPVRTGHAMAFDAARGRIVLFGGRVSGSGGLHLADTWEWTGTAWEQRHIPGPSARHLHEMVYDAARARVVLFGGGLWSSGSGTTPLGDTWEYDGEAWTQLPVSGPPASAEHALAYDAARQRIVMFTPSHTWEFDGGSWHLALVNPETMWGRTNPAFAYDSARQRCVLYGGGSGYSGILQWDGASWSTLTQFSNLSGQIAPMVFDSFRARFVLFGGGETWELASSPAGPHIDTHPTSFQQVYPGQTVTLSVEASGDGPFTYEWRRQNSHWRVTDGPNGASLYGGTVSGATTPNLTITGVQPSDANNFDHFRCHVTNACGTRISNGAAITLFFCGSPDFDNDGAPGTDADIEAFFACLAGSCCPTCGTADFNNDGDTGTDRDIEAFFRVLAGGTC
jgi:hypothetical protein